MFGVTTPGLDAVRAHLELRGGGGPEALVFYATGHGGLAMEMLVREGELDAMLGLATTEICGFVAWGEHKCRAGPAGSGGRGGHAACAASGGGGCGEFRTRATVPERYRDGKLYEHDLVVTLVRMSSEECQLVGEFLCSQLEKHVKRPELVEVWIPRRGVSVMPTPGGPFAGTEAHKVLFSAIRNGLQGSGIRVVEDTTRMRWEAPPGRP